MIAALYVQKGGTYYGLDGVEPWDGKRDARLYAGPWPVVAHPPCSHWCRLAPVNAARYESFRIGDDGDCFRSALAAVERWGGVLEHPAYSLAWSMFGLPAPRRGYWLQSLTAKGWVTEVSQSAYGHAARKRTWLYYVGDDPIDLDWSDPSGAAVIGGGINSGECVGRPKLGPRESSATPPEFRDLLIALAETCHKVEAAA